MKIGRAHSFAAMVGASRCDVLDAAARRPYLGMTTLILLSLVLGSAVPAAHAAESDDEVEARKIVLELAGAFSNDGFKMRDGHWSGTVKPKERVLVAVNLFAGNQYWFSAGTNEKKVKKIAVELYDENGLQVVTENYNSGEKAAAGFSPTSSGQYYVSIELLEGDASTFCLVYSYK